MTDPERQPDRLQELYQRLSAARKEAGEQPLAFDRFTQVVHAQMRKLKGTGEVTFRVDVRSGKATLTARPADETEK